MNIKWKGPGEYLLWDPVTKDNYELGRLEIEPRLIELLLAYDEIVETKDWSTWQVERID